MLKKVLKTGTQSALGLAIAFEIALLNMPDLVSSSLDEYMEENDIPKSLVENIQVDNIRVYDKPDGLSSFHLSGMQLWNNAKNIDSVSALLGSASAFGRPFPSISSAYGECMISMPEDLSKPEEFLANTLEIPLEDMELSDKEKDIFWSYVLLHEIGHAQPLEDGLMTKEYCHNWERSREFLLADQDYLAFQDEFKSELVALSAIDDPDITRLAIAYRAVTGFISEDVAHDFGIYISDALEENVNYGSIAVQHLKERQPFIDRVFQPFLDRYSEGMDKTYRGYLAALDFMDDEDTQNGVSENMLRRVRLFIEGVEYFAPRKTQELRIERENVAAMTLSELSV